MISMKDYAESKGISYEAVRKQVKRYKNELEAHVHKEGRTQFLDDEAVSFLDSKRAESPIVLIQANKDEEIERLTAENKALLIEVAELQRALLKEKDRVSLLQEEKIALLTVKQEEALSEKKPWWRFW